MDGCQILLALRQQVTLRRQDPVFALRQKEGGLRAPGASAESTQDLRNGALPRDHVDDLERHGFAIEAFAIGAGTGQCAHGYRARIPVNLSTCSMSGAGESATPS